MRVLVTGAHGFLGSHISEALLANGDSVRALLTPWGSDANLAHLLHHERLEVVRADLTADDSVHGMCDGVDAVVHAAARVADWGPWDAFYRTNVVATRALLHEAAHARCGRFLFISSVAVHRYSGFRNADPREQPRDNLRNAYAYSKILAEDLVLGAEHLESVVVRPGLWPFGERDPTFARVAKAVAKGILPVMRRGSTVLNTAYAPNFAHGVVLALHEPHAAGKVYVIADAGMPSWRELFDTIGELLGADGLRLRLPGRPTTALASGVEATWSALLPLVEPPVTRYRARLMLNDVHFSLRHAEEELGYAPLFTWRQGLSRTVAALGAIRNS
jgi:nucleoside-diphosphate-sugar epimerase